MLERLQATRVRARARVCALGHEAQAGDPRIRLHPVEVESENKEQAAPHWKHDFGLHLLLGSSWTRRRRPWWAGCGPEMPAPTPPWTTWICWTQRWPSFPGQPRPRIPSWDWKCWCARTRRGPAMASWARCPSGGWRSGRASIWPSRCGRRSCSSPDLAQCGGWRRQPVGLPSVPNFVPKVAAELGAPRYNSTLLDRLADLKLGQNAIT